MRKTLAVLFAAFLAMLPALALAKTSSEATAAPGGDTEVFYVQAGEGVQAYTWADITGESGLFKTASGKYGAKDANGEAGTQEWTGIPLRTILADAQDKLGIAFPQDAQVTAMAADGYNVSFPLQEVMDEANRYLAAGEPVRNFDGDATYDDSFVRILRGDETTMANQANLRCIMGVAVTDKEGKALASAGAEEPVRPNAKLPGGTDEEILNAIFYIAVAPLDGSETLFYYYSLEELKAMGQESYAFNYDDHTVDRTTECNGVFLTDLIDSLADEAGKLLSETGRLNDSMKIQIVEEDGYHSNYSGKASSYVDEISYARTTTLPILAWEIKETYQNETEFNQSWTDFRWADTYKEYMRIYRNTGAANSAVCKMVMGAVVSPNGDAYQKDTKGEYTITMTSTKNPGVELTASRTVGGVMKGMKIAVRAPEVANAAVSGDAVKLIQIGEESQKVAFAYDEETYLTLSNGTGAYEMTLSDLIALSGGRQIPQSLEAVEALTASGGALVVTDEIANGETGALSVDAPARNLFIDRREVAGGTDLYGYGNLILYRYFGAPLESLAEASGLDGELTLNGRPLKELNAADVFVAYKHTCSKATPNNPPEGKRITSMYEAPVLVSVYNGAHY